jgi:8-oxo-dGTP diphosphatase
MVVAALILRDSRILVCQRRRDDSHALQWEFPGGKVEPGELPQEALVRELREELGVEAVIGRELFRTRHQYREFGQTLELIFFQANVDRSAPLQNLVFEGFEWADPGALPGYDFLQADEEFVALLASHAIPLDRSA